MDILNGSDNGLFKGKMVEAEELKGHYPISILFIKNKKKIPNIYTTK